MKNVREGIRREIWGEGEVVVSLMAASGIALGAQYTKNIGTIVIYYHYMYSIPTRLVI